jgi:hypothetical protein
MKTRILWAGAALALAGSALAAEVPVDLTSWQKRGPSANGNWTVAADGESVFQSINGDPTFFVSPANSINTTLRGKIEVETTGDDDLIGFVFGFNAPAGTGNDMNFVLVDWKQATQNFDGVTSSEGFSVNRVQGNITDYLPGFWGRADSAGFDSLATNYGDNLGWEDNTEYTFTILYQTNHLSFEVAGGAFGAGQVVFDIAGSFPDGAFGFYNYSQAAVRYSGLTLEDTPPPIPEPGTWALMLLGLAGTAVAARRRRG